MEGAVKDEGRGPTIWDVATRVPGFVADGSNGENKHFISLINILTDALFYFLLSSG